jgi:hypothetical protein
MGTELGRWMTFVKRVVGAAKLSPRAYEDVEADTGATPGAIAVVAASSLAAGIGARGFGDGRPEDVLFFALLSLAAWASWAVLTYQIGVRLLPEPQTQANAGQIVRTLAFATAPGMLRVAGLWAPLTAPVFGATALWMLMAMIVALRQALDYRGVGRAIAVCVVAWALTITAAILIGVFFAPVVW